MAEEMTHLILPSRLVKGGYLIIKGNPCWVTEITSKVRTGSSAVSCEAPSSFNIYLFDLICGAASSCIYQVKGTGPTANDRITVVGHNINTCTRTQDVINLTAGNAKNGVEAPVVTVAQ
jgi:hypothetical protein